MIVPFDILRQFAVDVLTATGLDAFSVEHTAAALVEASVRGVDSHGIRLLPHYVEAIAAGRLNKSPLFSVERTGPSTTVLDADHALGFPAGVRAVAEGMTLARDQGMAAVVVKNSSHGGMLAYYTMAAARKGFFALAMTNTTPRLIPPGARTAFLGTNPISYAFPSDPDPICYDAATTMITGNKIKLHRTLNKPLPDGVAADAEGNLTTDPHIAEFLAPFGGYKGFGIALLVDIFCGLMSGMPDSNRVSKMFGGDLSAHRLLGQFFLLLDVSRFREQEDFVSGLSDEVKRLRGLSRENGDRCMAPGDKELECAAKRRQSGIPIEEEVVEALDNTAMLIGVTPLAERFSI